jgi:hypothetical protein
VLTKPPDELTKAPVAADHPIEEVVGERHRLSFLSLTVTAQRPFSTRIGIATLRAGVASAPPGSNMGTATAVYLAADRDVVVRSSVRPG